jgi:hypothetical protein
MMPLASVLAAAGGVILLFGRTILGFFTRGFRGIGRALRPGASMPAIPVGQPAGRRSASEAPAATPTPADPDPVGHE